MKLIYYRHATLLLKFDHYKILVDPMYMKKGRMPPIPSTLNLRRNPLENFPREYPKMTEKDVLLITHHHFDHFDKIAAKQLPKKLLVISPANGFKRLKRMGYQNVIPMHPGQEVETSIVKILALPTKHSQNLEKFLYKPGLGYLIQSSMRNIYISGDTILFDKLLVFLEKLSVNVAIFYGGAARIPILGRHTMTFQEILKVVNKVNPQKSIIVHLNSLNHCTEDRTIIGSLIYKLNLSSKMIVPNPGEEYAFDSFKN